MTTGTRCPKCNYLDPLRPRSTAEQAALIDMIRKALNTSADPLAEIRKLLIGWKA